MLEERRGSSSLLALLGAKPEKSGEKRREQFQAAVAEKEELADGSTMGVMSVQ